MEHQVSDTLINTWAAILALMLFMYAALDGFDLGVGILSLLEADPQRKSVMMHSVGSVWDANETWLVLLGGTLFGAFPLAYAAALQALYLPVLLMLFALIFRGVAFEFCLYSQKTKGTSWLFAFGAGSLFAALAQGLALGGLLSGLPLNGADARIDIFAWFTPFSLLTAALLVTGYVVLGATYLVCKTDGRLRETATNWVWRSAILLGALLATFIFYSPMMTPYVTERWTSNPVFFSLLAATLIVSFSLMLWRLNKKSHSQPFFWCLCTLLTVLLGLVVSHYPYILPGVMTLHAAASSTKTLEFMLYAEGGLLPLMLIYNGYQYYALRGPVGENH